MCQGIVTFPGLAHELAHYIYDGHDKEKYKDTYITNQHQTPEEKKANEFAANLLMPQKLFLSTFFNALDQNVNVVKYLSDYFCVTERSVRKRVLEILSIYEKKD